MAFLYILLSLGRAHAVKVLLIGLFEVYAHLFNRREYNKRVRVHVPRKLFAGKVLVYNRGNAFKIARLVAHNGYSAAAHGDHHKARVVKRFHRVQLNYFNRQRRCDYPAPAAARILLHCIALFGGYGLGFFFGIEGAYGL